MHNNTATTNITDAQVNQQLAALNSNFLSTGIKFCLATRAGTGTSLPTVNLNYTNVVQTTPGIIHVLSPGLMAHTSTEISQNQLLFMPDGAITPDRYLRIWIVDSIDGALPGTLGYAWLPNGSYRDGIVIRNNVFGNGTTNLLTNYNQGEVLVHEVGHWLNLYHPFEGGCSIPSNNPLLDGDKVPDTPTVALPNYSCTTGTNSCLETPAVLDLINNHMDYGNDGCRTSFTTGQIDRMLSSLNFFRKNLTSNDNLIYTGICGFNNLVSSTITSSTYSPCSNTSVAFNAVVNTSCSYTWNFGDLTGVNNIITNTTGIANHIFATASLVPYIVTLTVTNTTTNVTSTSTAQIFVVSCAAISSDSSWFVGFSHKLNFNTGVPVFDNTFPIDKNGSNIVNSVSTTQGNLLFYTNGADVWNGNNDLINTLGSLSPGQFSFPGGNNFNRSLILPNPANSNQYMILTSGLEQVNPIDELGFEVSYVNILSGVATSVNPLRQAIIPSNTTAGYLTGANGAFARIKDFAAVKKQNSNEYWIITSVVKNNQYYVATFSLNSNGTITFVSEIILPTPTDIIEYNRLKIEISPNGNKIFLHNIYLKSYLYDFEKYTGLISNIKIIPTASNTTSGYVVSASFSPNSKLLYISEYTRIVLSTNLNVYKQINLNDPLLTPKIISSISGGYGTKQMQLGPDNKLYFQFVAPNLEDAGKLGVVHNPNNLVSDSNLNACNFTYNGPVKSTTSANPLDLTLPNLVDAKALTAYPVLPADKISAYLIGCNKYKFFPNVTNPTSSFVWTFTNTSVTPNTTFTSTLNDPEYEFTDNGNYNITVKNASNVVLASTTLTIQTAVTPTITGSTSACLTNNSQTNNSVILLPGQTVVWSITGGVGTITAAQNTQSSINVTWTTLPGQLTATVTDAAGCTSSRFQNIEIYCYGVGANDTVYTTKLQADGKIIFGGAFSSYGGNASNRIARLNTNMTFDNTFVVGTGANGTVFASAIQTDGKILIGGNFTTYNGIARNGIARLNSNGTLDTSFAVGIGIGSTSTNFFSINAIAIQSDGKIIIGGIFNSYNNTIRRCVARINTNGSIDTTFNSSFTTTDYDVTSIVIQTDGKIILGGGFLTYGTVSRSNIVRILTSGVLDTTFNIGTGFTDLLGDGGLLKSIKLQPDGKILAGGEFEFFNGVGRNRLARLNTNGTLDTTFIPDNIPLLGGGQGVNTIDLQSDNKIIIGGGFQDIVSGLNYYSRARIARLNTTGTVDLTFNPGVGFGPAIGRGSTHGILYPISVQPDGKFVTGGYFKTYNLTGVNNITRLNPSIAGAVGRPGLINNDSLEKNNTIEIFPNPFDNYFIISSYSQEIDNLEVYDVNGKLLKSQIIMSKNEKININDIPIGTYYLKIYNKFELVSSKVIIKK